MPKKPENPRLRFWRKVDREGECWMWLGKITRDGYGQFDVRGKKFGAHRFSWMLAHRRRVAKGLEVLHTCDKKDCVRPGHLFEGTQTDNIRDMMAKGRARFGFVVVPTRGAANVKAKLTAAGVAAIRDSEEGAGALARRYGVARSTINRVLSHATWG